MLREYVISEAMHALGVPTTRSLAVVGSGERVYRETPLPGAILARVASSHLRVGTFEFGALLQDEKLLQALADYAISRHDPDLQSEGHRYRLFLERVIERQASLVAQWMSIGFVHGVMNTDNVSISGETLDYGPCAFMDRYDESTVFSSIDHDGRYAFGNQPSVMMWNLARFAETLLPLLDEDPDKALAVANQSVEKFETLFRGYWLKLMASKLGFKTVEDGDDVLVQDFLNTVRQIKGDYTFSFRRLSGENWEDFSKDQQRLWAQWMERWDGRLSRQDLPKEDVCEALKKVNPLLIPRNSAVEFALDQWVNQGNQGPLAKLNQALQNPFIVSPEDEHLIFPGSSKRPYRTFCGT